MKRIFSVLLIAVIALAAMVLASCDLFPTEAPEVEHIHEYVVVSQVDPTCTEGGSIEYACECGDTYVEQLAPNGHDCATNVIKPTCVKGGYTENTCKVCGYFFRSDIKEVNPNNHDYESTVIDPSCNTDGYTLHVCKLCDFTKQDTVVAARHTYSAWKVVVETTCNDLGLSRRECIYCHAEDFKNASSEFYHVYDDGVVVDPDCTTAGYIEYTCTLCENKKIVANGKALGHDLGAWYVYTEQTCETKGENRRECSRCDYYESSVIEKHHFDINGSVDPTCTTLGKEWVQCSGCGEIRITNTTPALGHKFSDDGWHDVEGLPGCEQRECEHGCGAVETRNK